jgi:hypothetical protein
VGCRERVTEEDDMEGTLPPALRKRRERIAISPIAVKSNG